MTVDGVDFKAWLDGDVALEYTLGSMPGPGRKVSPARILERPRRHEEEQDVGVSLLPAATGRSSDPRDEVVSR